MGCTRQYVDDLSRCSRIFERGAIIVGMKSTISNEQKDKIITILRANGAVVGYLFGSYARGTAGTLSDIDIGVAFPKKMSSLDQEDRVENVRGSSEKIYGRDRVDVQHSR